MQLSTALTLGANASIDQAAPLLFFAIAALTVISSWAIVLSQSIIRMAVYLLLTLAGVAGLYFMMSAEFLAAIQMVVYAGGTLVLIIFGVMLTSKNPFAGIDVKPWEKALGPTIAVILAGLLFLAMVTSTEMIKASETPGSSEGPIFLIGRALLSDYIVPFEVAAVLLLVVMIGAAYMARRRVQE